MDVKKAIEMIDEYLLEPNNIHKDWVEILKLCRRLLVEKGYQDSISRQDKEGNNE